MKCIVQDYLRRLEKQLPCPRALREPFLQQLAMELDHFCARNPEADADALAECFGPPEDVAREFLAELNPQAAAASLRRRNKRLIVAVSVVLLALGTAGLIIHRQAPGESQVIASVKYDQGEGSPAAEVFVSTGEPAQALTNAEKPWYNTLTKEQE